MKPDDIPQDVWNKVCVVVPSYIDTSSYDLVRIDATRVSVARAILQARSQAFEEAADIAEHLAQEQDAVNEKYPLHVEAYPAWEVYPIKLRIAAQAIRQHSQKGRDK